MRPPLHGLVLIAVLSIGACSSESGDAAPIEELDLPEGFSATAVVPRLGRARHLVVRDNGDIYVALRRPTRRGSIAALRDTDGDGAADMVRYFYNKGGTGIRQCIAMAWHPEDNCLYAVQHGRDQLHAFFPEHFTVKGSKCGLLAI